MIEILEKLYQNVFRQKGSNSLLKRILMFSCFHSNISCKISSNKIIIGSNKMITNTTPLREKCQNTGLFSGPYFPAFGLNEERSSLSVFSPNVGKYGPEKNSVFGHFSRSACASLRFRGKTHYKGITCSINHSICKFNLV